MNRNSISGPKSPRVSTIKRLFAASGNQCAFEGCFVPAHDASSDDVLLEICHIEGARPNSARYRESQPDEELHGFSNLMLLCGHHHNLVDSDEAAFTVERLQGIKAAHEADGGKEGDDDATDDVVTRLLVNHVAITIHAEDVVVSQGQLGGQTAHTIINREQQPWLLAQPVAHQLTVALQNFPSLTCKLRHVQGDPDSTGLARQLRSILEDASWVVAGAAMLGANTPSGIQFGLALPENRSMPDQLKTLVSTLHGAAIIEEPIVIPDPSCKELTVIVGHRP